MPTEYELKFILDKRIIQDMVALFGKKEYSIKNSYIRQGYLSNGCRIREIDHCWFFTCKIPCFNGKTFTRNIEIETSIDEKDGKDLWELCTSKLEKIRYKILHDNVMWELDFLINGTEVYFIQLEVELPEEAEPIPVLDLLKPYVTYNVPLGDIRFTNKYLSDVDFAKGLYESLTRWH